MKIKDKREESKFSSAGRKGTKASERRNQHCYLSMNFLAKDFKRIFYMKSLWALAYKLMRMASGDGKQKHVKADEDCDL